MSRNISICYLVLSTSIDFWIIFANSNLFENSRADEVSSPGCQQIINFHANIAEIYTNLPPLFASLFVVTLIKDEESFVQPINLMFPVLIQLVSFSVFPFQRLHTKKRVLLQNLILYIILITTNIVSQI